MTHAIGSWSLELGSGLDFKKTTWRGGVIAQSYARVRPVSFHQPEKENKPVSEN